MPVRAKDWFNHGPLQSEEAIKYAREIIEFVRNKMA